MSTSQTRSNCRAIVLVRCSMRRRSVRASRSSLNQRSAHREWSSRSGQPWQGCARSWVRSSSIRRSPPWCGPWSPRPLRRLPGAAGSGCGSARSVEARSRRDCGLRPLKLRGTFTRVIEPTGVGKSTRLSRRACLSAVST